MEPEQLMLMLLDQAWVQGWFLLQLVVPDRLQVLLLRRQKNGKAEKWEQSSPKKERNSWCCCS